MLFRSHRSIVGENGAGHGDYFVGKDGRPYYVYHVHHNDSTIHPRMVRIAPLNMELDSVSGIYRISVDSDNIIVPKRIKSAE